MTLFEQMLEEQITWAQELHQIKAEDAKKELERKEEEKVETLKAS